MKADADFLLTKEETERLIETLNDTVRVYAAQSDKAAKDCEMVH